jgi:hypothetical protein
MRIQFEPPRVFPGILSIAVWLLANSTALGFVLTPGENGIVLETPSALYVISAGGSRTRVLQLGATVPSGGTVSEIGVPAFLHDGSMIFAVQVRTNDKVEWRILRADTKQPNVVKIRPAMATSAASSDCRPVLKTDLHIVTDEDAAFAFVADREGGGSALFRYSSGRLTCEVRTGDRTAEGNLIASLGFGSAMMSQDATVVLQTKLARDEAASANRPTRNAIVLTRRDVPPREIAVQGNRTRDGAIYGAHFGLPAISAVAGGDAIVAFTNQTNRGTALFLGPTSAPVRTFSVGSKVDRRAITYLSDGRPALASEGSVAMMAAARNQRLILVIRDGEPSVAARDGQVISNENRLTGIGDPVAMGSGGISIEGMNPSGHDCLVFVPAEANGAKAEPNAQEIFPSSAAIDRQGRIAFLVP